MDGVDVLVPTANPVDTHVPAIAALRNPEQRILSAPLEGSVLRFPTFMEVWLALVGSSIPLRGEPFATVGPLSRLLRRYRALTGSLVQDRGLMRVPGVPGARPAPPSRGGA